MVASKIILLYYIYSNGLRKECDKEVTGAATTSCLKRIL